MKWCSRLLPLPNWIVIGFTDAHATIERTRWDLNQPMAAFLPLLDARNLQDAREARKDLAVVVAVAVAAPARRWCSRKTSLPLASVPVPSESFRDFSASSAHGPGFRGGPQHDLQPLPMGDLLSTGVCQAVP